MIKTNEAGRDAGPDPNASCGHPSGDERFARLEVSMNRRLRRADALIEVLHDAQVIFGRLDPDILMYVARGLRLPPSRVHGVATFYHLFKFNAKADHNCVVCLGTACYVKGGDELLRAAEQGGGVHPGETHPSGRLSLETARCVGTCGIAPVVVYDEEVLGNQAPELVRERLKGWLRHEHV